MRLLHLAGAILAAMICVSSPAKAQTLVTDLTQWVGEPYKSSTYLDLMALAVPSFMNDGDGYYTRQAFPLRHVSDEPDRKETIEVGGLLGSPRVMPIETKGHKRLAMLFELTQPTDSAERVTALALFDLDHEPKLLDFANVAYDRQTGFFDPARLTLPDGSTTLLITSGHSNSNQAYHFHAMIDLRGDRLHLIDTFFLLNDNACRFERTQQPRFAAAGSPKQPAIQVTVTETVTRRNVDCGSDPAPQTGKRTFSVRYQWRSKTKRFIRNSDALDRLSEEASKHL
ncbi:MAG: hypothetical protein J0H71_01290 [Rhizobiales bacterium]|nr:hypothetical protein [Hyphomicrobiales bacterium]